MSGDKSFVVADIPGLIEGASEGAGLGIRFLKHLTRTRLLLHLVDMMPFDGSTPGQNAKIIERELETFSPTLAAGDRWLVINKVDLLREEDIDAACQEVVEALDWQGPVFRMSGLASVGTKVLCAAIMDYIDDHRQQELADPKLAELAEARRTRIQTEARDRIDGLAETRRVSRQQPQLDDHSGDDGYDDDDVEVVYAE
jgi:GTP-binding protein